MHKDVSINKIISIKDIDVGALLSIENVECLGKDIKEVKETLRCLYSKKVKLKINNISFDLEKDINSYFATLEILTYLIQRQSTSRKIGIDIARKSGKQIGRRKIEFKDLPQVFLSSYDTYKKGNITKIDFSKLCSCSRPTLDKWIKCYEEYVKK